mmetsp:Transcript_103408/g.186603  ORF Transcript_103408/g.186603 Transcript_103408/m.186603 type:complete len:730 (-) Transcript_103408:74-2263(-)
MGCSANDLAMEKGGNWVLEYDVGIPAQRFFTIVLGTLLYLFACIAINALFANYKVTAPVAEEPMMHRFAKSKELWFRVLFLFIGCCYGLPIMYQSCESCDGSVNYCNNWLIMFLYGLVFIGTASVASRPFDFYLGEGLTLGDTFRFYVRGTPLPNMEEIERAAGEMNRTEQGTANHRVGFWTLMPSTFISWIFAKSIRNAAVLGGMYGMRGGVAYASWYVSFWTAGIVCYLLRTKYNFKSMSTAVYSTYGMGGVLCFQACLLFRLFNEIWSNATVIGSFYGPLGSSGYWGACWLSTLIPCVYVIMGGMRASLYSDVLQAALAVIFLIVVLVTIQSDKTFADNAGNAFTWTPTTLYPKTGEWYDNGWWTCFLGGLIQGTLSYPFFDPVLTDRGFLSSPKTMLLSFFVGGALAAMFIVFYAVIGIYGAFFHEYYAAVCGCGLTAGTVFTKLAGCPTTFDACQMHSYSAGDPAYSAWVLGKNTYGAVDPFIAMVMITASMSTLDSTFTSWAKLISLELGGWAKLKGDRRDVLGPLKPQDQENISDQHILVARLSIVILMIIGVSFLGTEKDAMAATSAAGSMVMGIGWPIWAMCFWKVAWGGKKGWVQAPMAFMAPFAVGVVFGWGYYQDGKNKGGWTYDVVLGTDDLSPKGFYYSRFFGVNVWGHLASLAAFIVFFAFHQLFPKLWFWNLEEVHPEAETVAMADAVSKEKVETDGEAAPKDAEKLQGELTI